MTRLPLVDLRHELPSGEQLFARLTYADALVVAAREGAQLLAPGRINDLRKPGVALQLRPYLGTPTAETDILHSERHDHDVWRQLHRLDWDGFAPVVGAGKHWVAGAPTGRSRLEGWDRDGSGPGLGLWQPDSVAHNRDHHDDGTTTVLERPTAAARAALDTLTRETQAAGEYDARRPTLRLGTVGEPVREWQRVLLRDDHPVWTVPVTGVYDAPTRDLTIRWQRAHGLVPDGIVGRLTWAASDVPAPPDTLPAPPPSSVAIAVGGQSREPPRIICDMRTVLAHPSNYQRGRHGQLPRFLMLHTAEIDEVVTAAEQLAAWCSRPILPKPVSWHFAVDCDSIVCCVPEADGVYACPGFCDIAIHIELAGYARQGKAGWDDDYSRAVLANAAALVIDILGRHWQIPPLRPTVAEMLRGTRSVAAGIIGHCDGTAALAEAQRLDMRVAPWWDSRPGRGWKRSSHTDPGPTFPWDSFLAAVRGGLGR